MSKIIIGSAQFGSRYGITNEAGEIAQEEIETILRLGRTAGVSMLDTAISYGNAEERIGISNSAGYEIITKLPSIPKEQIDVFKWIYDEVNNSLRRLKRKSIYGLLLHNPMDVLGSSGDVVIRALNLLKEDGLIERYGISIYSPLEIEALFSGQPKFIPDIVQSPLNIFDRSIETSGWLDNFNAMSIEVHARSIYLQGLLLQDPKKRSKNFVNWDGVFEKYDSWIRESGVSPLSACIAHALSYPQISGVIIGVTTATELEQALAASVCDHVRAPAVLQSIDNDLINPMKWGRP
jgi:aryl-alcohol dehydrogenase-like predicted oxidoreductase